MSRRNHDLQTIRSEGGLLPPDLLRRVLDPKEQLDGTRPEDYGLPQGERLNEVITQSWNRLRKHWAEFRAAAEHLPATEPGTGLTNDKWSLPLLRELGFGLLPTSAGPEIAGRTYAINRFFGPVPIHLVGCGLSLDRRAAGVRGAAAANPHGLVQEFINRSPGHLWAIVSNGLDLRLLRDNQALSRQSFLEFDLQAMFAGEAYSDFVLLWLTAHATRFAPREGDRPESCWLEQWTKVAEEQGTRALGDLRGGVEKALQILGEGFTSHPKNTALREGLRTGEVPLAEFHGQLLRVIYRLIFLFVAEDRTLDDQSLLHPHDDSDIARTARERFADHYSTSRLRELAAKIRGSRHTDLWRQFRLLAGALSGDEAFSAARQHLALPTLGSFLWHLTSTATLNEAELTNHDFLEAVRHLAFTRQGRVLRPVDYKNLGAEELGGVYESLLALTPQVSADGSRFTFAEFAGNERKTSGSYYTPDSLVQCLLDSALDPVVEEAIKDKTGTDAERAIFSLKICDPAVGSGHFLVGAAHRLAWHLARVRALAQGESEASPLLYQHALRDVIGRCLYGVDVNPMAAELCRVSLWLEALEPGKPLSFLDHHIRVGNSLLGTTPDLIAAGLPDDAFNAIEGDDRKACAALKKRNRAERKGLGPLFSEQESETQARLQQAAAALEQLPDDRPEEVRAKELAFRRHEETEEYRHKKQLADSWCAAFVIRRRFTEPSRESSLSGITQGHLNALVGGRALPDELCAAADRASREYGLFHWHLVFPEVFAEGGFDVVLGNPPWERIKIQEKEWFAGKRDDIAQAGNAAERKRLIESLKSDDPALHAAFMEDQRKAEGESHFVRNSGRFPLCGRGDINTYSIFTETNRLILGPTGRIGCVIPSGIATDDTTKFFFQSLVTSHSLVSLYDFENVKNIFPGVGHGRFKFCLLTLSGSESSVAASDFVFFAHQVEDIGDVHRHFTLTARDIALINPNTFTCPIFGSKQDAEIGKHIYRRVPILVRDGPPEENPWGITFMRMLDMATDSGLFQMEALPDHVPLYEAKMIQHFDHRYGDYADYPEGALTTILPDVPKERLEDPGYEITPRYWVDKREVLGRLHGKWEREWLLGWRDVTHATNDRTLIASVVPRTAVNHKFPLMFPSQPSSLVAGLLANLNSFLLDHCARQKLGGLSLVYFILKQLPVLLPDSYEQQCGWVSAREPAVGGPVQPMRGVEAVRAEQARTTIGEVPSTLMDWLLPRVLELVYTAWDLEPFARDCGWSGPPFRWDEERRFVLRCELDAAFFHLYLPAENTGGWRLAEGETTEDLARLQTSFLTPRDAVAYIMDTFLLVKRKDEAKWGDYRTKRIILDIYDAMQKAIRTGLPYRTRLDPPAADPTCRHPKKAIGILAFGSLIADPGPELAPKITMRIKTPTPFPVEYGRYSGKTRGQAPTVVRHEAGAPVSAEILVLNDAVTVAEATDMLWRRERRKCGSGETYVEGTSANSVLVRCISDSPCVSNVLFTDFHAEGKIDNPDAKELATRTIQSVKAAKDGMDGISYLMSNLALGIETPLTQVYKAEVLRQTMTETLQEALNKVKSETA
jgi:hypothetical protein